MYIVDILIVRLYEGLLYILWSSLVVMVDTYYHHNHLRIRGIFSLATSLQSSWDQIRQKSFWEINKCPR